MHNEISEQPPSGSDQDTFQQLQEALQYRFSSVEYLIEALTHKSYANEMQLPNCYGNERLEFIGDAVLGLIISHILMKRVPNCSEGKLSNMRAAVVNEEALSSLAKTFQLGDYIFLSRGEDDSGGREKKSILANVCEALIAAIYFDSGFQPAFDFIENHFSALIDEVIKNGYYRDFKSRLQEYAQRVWNAVPRYVLTMEEGPDHGKIFESQVLIGKILYEKGQGCSKKASEQDAAEKTLNLLLGGTIS